MGRRYGFFNLLLDVLLVLITGGLWIFWIIFREIRQTRREVRYYGGPR